MEVVGLCIVLDTAECNYSSQHIPELFSSIYVEKTTLSYVFYTFASFFIDSVSKMFRWREVVAYQKVEAMVRGVDAFIPMIPETH